MNRSKLKLKNRQMKGVEPVVAAVVLISIALMTALILYNWQGGFIHSYTSGIESSTQQKLRCEKANIEILNASLDCNSCTLLVKMKNYGDVSLDVIKVYVTSNEKIMDLSGGSFEVGEVKTISNRVENCANLKNAISEVRTITECSGVSDFTSSVNYVNC